MPTLGKLISQPMQDEPPPLLNFQQKVDRWMINEGSRRMYLRFQSYIDKQFCHCVCSAACYGLLVWFHELWNEGTNDR